MPFVARWNLYQAERFPLVSHTIAIALLFASTWFAAEALVGPGPLHVGTRAVLAFVATFLTMLMLRVFDEFKDFEDDRINHPDRVVQRGIVTLRELAVLGWLIVAILVAVNVPLGASAGLAYAAVFGFALLMRVEFFVRDWLKKHVFTYALTHQGITPLVCLYIGTAALGTLAALPRGFLAAIVSAVGVGLCFEVSRKFQAPEDETETLDTYTRRFGSRGASWVALGCLLIAADGANWLCIRLHLPIWSQGLITAALLIGAVGYGRFAASPTARKAKLVKDQASIAVVLIDLALVAGLIAARGVVLGN